MKHYSITLGDITLAVLLKRPCVIFPPATCSFVVSLRLAYDKLLLLFAGTGIKTSIN